MTKKFEYLPGAKEVDGTGEENYQGSYIQLVFDTDNGVQKITVSRGGIEIMINELWGLGFSTPDG